MDLTIDDRARLMPLLRSAVACAKRVLASPDLTGDDRTEDWEDSLEWGEDMLRRLELEDED